MMQTLKLLLLLGTVLAVVPVRGEEGDCPEFECPAKVLSNNFCTLETQRECRLHVIQLSKSSQSLSFRTVFSVAVLCLSSSCFFTFHNRSATPYLHAILFSSVISFLCILSFICSYLSGPDFLFVLQHKECPLQKEDMS